MRFRGAQVPREHWALCWISQSARLGSRLSRRWPGFCRISMRSSGARFPCPCMCKQRRITSTGFMHIGSKVWKAERRERIYDTKGRFLSVPSFEVNPTRWWEYHEEAGERFGCELTPPYQYHSNRIGVHSNHSIRLLRIRLRQVDSRGSEFLDAPANDPYLAFYEKPFSNNKRISHAL